MKKLKNCLRRFGAFLSACLMICCLTAPALAAASDAAPMPSHDEFKSHPDSFYVWRTSAQSNHYELIAGRIFLNSDGFALSGSAVHTYSNVLKSFDYRLSDGSHSVFGCAIPSPIRFNYSTLSQLPAFRIDSCTPWYVAMLHFYPLSGQDLSSVYCFIVPFLGSSDRSLVFSNSESSSIDSFDAAFFDSPFLSYPFATRSYSSSDRAGFHVVGGTPLFDSYDSSSFLTLANSYYISGSTSLSPYPNGYTVSSSDIGVVFIKKPSFNYITDVADYSVSVKGCFSFFVNKTLLPDVQPGDWISSGDLEKMQDQLVNDFGVNSDTLKNSKQNFDSWQNSNSIDTDIANSSFDVFNALMQNFGQFVAIVALLCFGAVVIRVLIRKAVEG